MKNDAKDKNTKDEFSGLRERAEKIFQDQRADYPDPSELSSEETVENSLMAVVQSGLDGEIIFANQKAAEFLDFKDAREFVRECDLTKIYTGK